MSTVWGIYSSIWQHFLDMIVFQPLQLNMLGSATPPYHCSMAEKKKMFFCRGCFGSNFSRSGWSWLAIWLWIRWRNGWREWRKWKWQWFRFTHCTNNLELKDEEQKGFQQGAIASLGMFVAKHKKYYILMMTFLSYNITKFWYFTEVSIIFCTSWAMFWILLTYKLHPCHLRH